MTPYYPPPGNPGEPPRPYNAPPSPPPSAEGQTAPSPPAGPGAHPAVYGPPPGFSPPGQPLAGSSQLPPPYSGRFPHNAYRSTGAVPPVPPHTVPPAGSFPRPPASYGAGYPSAGRQYRGGASPYTRGHPYMQPGYPPYSAYDLYRERDRLLKKNIRKDSNTISFGLLCFFLSTILFILLFGAIQPAPGGIAYELYNAAISVLSILTPLAVILMILRIPIQRALPLEVPPPRLAVPAVPLMLGVSCLEIMVSILLTQFLAILGLQPVSYESPLPITLGASLVYLLRVSVLPAVCEEFLFRGAIMQSLRRYGDRFALLASALLFGLLHGNLLQSVNATIAGLVLGYFVLLTGSIWIGVLMHFFNNFNITLLQLLTQNLSEDAAVMIYLVVFSLYLVMGALCALYLYSAHPYLFKVPKGGFPLREDNKYQAFFTSAGWFLFLAIILYSFVKSLEFIR